jgi:uncharacterized cysteine cluster protein YcgN (CxxCxxCC family)
MKSSLFWKTKSLEEMNHDEWESLCDGCARCCLQKIEDEDTGQIQLTPVSCDFLDISNCRCMVYEDRDLVNPNCVTLTLDKLRNIRWLPTTCAYRCLAEGRELEWWHPLVSSNPGTVHKAGISVRDKLLPGQYVHPDDLAGGKECCRESARTEEARRQRNSIHGLCRYVSCRLKILLFFP